MKKIKIPLLNIRFRFIGSLIFRWSRAGLYMPNWLRAWHTKKEIERFHKFMFPVILKTMGKCKVSDLFKDSEDFNKDSYSLPVYLKTKTKTHIQLTKI